MAKEETKAAPTMAAAAPAPAPAASPAKEWKEPIKADTVVTPAAEVTKDGPGIYRVSLGVGESMKTADVEATDANHAWAIFCDAMKSWPPPKRSDRKIERVA